MITMMMTRTVRTMRKRMMRKRMMTRTVRIMRKRMILRPVFRSALVLTHSPPILVTHPSLWLPLLLLSLLSLRVRELTLIPSHPARSSHPARTQLPFPPAPVLWYPPQRVQSSILPTPLNLLPPESTIAMLSVETRSANPAPSKRLQRFPSVISAAGSPTRSGVRQLNRRGPASSIRQIRLGMTLPHFLKKRIVMTYTHPHSLFDSRSLPLSFIYPPSLSLPPYHCADALDCVIPQAISGSARNCSSSFTTHLFPRLQGAAPLAVLTLCPHKHALFDQSVSYIAQRPCRYSVDRLSGGFDDYLLLIFGLLSLSVAEILLSSEAPLESARNPPKIIR